MPENVLSSLPSFTRSLLTLSRDYRTSIYVLATTFERRRNDLATPLLRFVSLPWMIGNVGLATFSSEVATFELEVASFVPMLATFYQLVTKLGTCWGHAGDIYDVFYDVSCDVFYDITANFTASFTANITAIVIGKGTDGFLEFIHVTCRLSPSSSLQGIVQASLSSALASFVS